MLASLAAGYGQFMKTRIGLTHRFAQEDPQTAHPLLWCRGLARSRTSEPAQSQGDPAAAAALDELDKAIGL